MCHVKAPIADLMPGMPGIIGQSFLPQFTDLKKFKKMNNLNLGMLHIK